MPPIRAILFDADGVVQHSGASDLPVRLQRALGVVPPDLETFTREVFDLERSALAGQADFAEALGPLVARLGVPDAAGKLATEWWCSIEEDKAVLALVSRLRHQGILCALATNQQSYRARHMDEALSYRTLFDRCFYSHQLGYVKPDLRYFESIIAALALTPEEFLFIDDSQRNVAAAGEVGMHAAHFVLTDELDSVATMMAILESFSITID